MSHKQEITEPDLEAEEAKGLELDEQSKPQEKLAIQIFQSLILLSPVRWIERREQEK
jgi:hypothetical protein